MTWPDPSKCGPWPDPSFIHDACAKCGHMIVAHRADFSCSVCESTISFGMAQQVPEVQAMRLALLHMAGSLAYGCNDDTNHRDAGGRFTLLESPSTLRECWLAEFLPADSPHLLAWILAATGTALRA